MYIKTALISIFFCIVTTSCYSADKAYVFCKKILGFSAAVHMLNFVPDPRIVISHTIGLCINKKNKKESLFKRRKINLIDAPFLIFDEAMEGVVYTAEDMHTPAPLRIPASDYRYAAPALFEMHGKKFQHVVFRDNADNEILRIVEIIE